LSAMTLVMSKWPCSCFNRRARSRPHQSCIVQRFSRFC
jgi:hypothetical protein